MERYAWQTAVAVALAIAAVAAHGAMVTETWTGANGSPWPAQWTRVVQQGFESDVSAHDITANQGRFAPIYWNNSSAGTAIFNFLINTTDLTKVDQRVSFDFGSNASWTGLIARSTAADRDTYYLARVRGHFAGINIYRVVDGVFTSIGSASTPVIDHTKNWSLRFIVQQNPANPAQTTLNAKIWELGTAEPVTWTVSANDAEARLQNRSGNFGLYYGCFYNVSILYDNYQANTVPEPGAALLAAAAAVLGWARRRR